MYEKLKFWLSGIVAAAAGIVLVRVVPAYLFSPGLKFAAYVVGILLAISGVLIVMIGISRGLARS
jgi:hypothetical protein